MKKNITLLGIAVLLGATLSAEAAISMLISDDGANLTLTATGTYTLEDAIPIGSLPLGTNAAVANLIAGGVFGWDAGGGATTHYQANYFGSLTGTANAFPATSTTFTNPFFLARDLGIIAFSTSAPISGSVNNTAIFNGTTIDSLGMVRGESMTVTWGNAGPDETLTITVVPEPSACLLSVLALPAFFRRRR